MKTPRGWRLTAVSFLVLGVRSVNAGPYTLTDLGTLGGNSSSAYGINDAGQIAGSSVLPGNLGRAFRYSGGVMTNLSAGLSAPWSGPSGAWGINDAGQVAGFVDLGGEYRATVFSAGGATDLGTYGGQFTQSSARGINNAGQVAGYGLTAYSNVAFLHSGGVMSDLGTLGGTSAFAYGINNSGQVAGSADTAGDAAHHAFLYSGGVMSDLGALGGAISSANGVNDAGQVVGSSVLADNFSVHAFRYSGGVMSDLGTLGGTSSAAYGINNAGYAVGSSLTVGDAAAHAFLYYGNAMTDLNAFIPSGSAFSRLDSATAINSVGQIVGIGTTASGATHAFLFTANEFHLAAGSGSKPLSTEGLAPSFLQPVFIDPDTTRSIINLSGGSLSIATLTVGAKISGTAELKLSNAAATSVGDISVQTRGALTLEGGVLTGASLDNAGTLNQGSASQLTVTGRFTNTGTTILGGTTSLGSFTNQSGEATLQSGALTVGVLDNAGVFTQSGGTLVAGSLTNTGTAILTTGYSITGAVVNQGSLTLGGESVTVGSLLNGYGAQLTAPGTVNLTAGQFVNSGALTAPATLQVNGGAFVNNGEISLGVGQSIHSNFGIASNGGVTLAGGSLAAASVNGPVDIGSGGTITGFGTLTGVVSNNGGIVRASGGTLTLDGSSASNSGLMRVDNGSVLLSNGSLSNSGDVSLEGIDAVLAGGTVSNTGVVRGTGMVSSKLLNSGILRTEGGSLTMTGAGGTNAEAGEIRIAAGTTVRYTEGLATNAGTIELLGGGFENSAKPLANGGTIAGHGALETGGLTNNGQMNFDGGETTVSGAAGNNRNVRVTAGTVTFLGAVTNNAPGTFTNTGGEFHFLGGFTNNGAYVSDPADNFFTDLTVGASGFLVGGEGDRFFVSGDFHNASTRNADWDTDQAELAFVTGGSHQFDVMSQDLGTSYFGYVDNFAWGILHVGVGQTLTLLDGGAAGGAFYVGALMLDGGVAQLSSLFTGGMSVYYNPTLAANAYLARGTYELDGGGVLAASEMPEPGTVLLFCCGLAGLAALRRAIKPLRVIGLNGR